MAGQDNLVEADAHDEAAQAFQSLTREVADVRAELAVMRRAVEAIAPALSEAVPPDYSLTLGEMATVQRKIVAALTKIEAHPALQIEPETYAARTARVIEQSTRGSVRDAENLAQAIRSSAREIEAVLGSARTHKAQNRRLAQSVVVGIVAGLVLFPLLGFPLTRALPFGSLPDSLAASALGEDRWSAGMGLMMRANPQQWTGLVEGYTIARAGGDELKGCYDTASRTGQGQRCAITIRPPAAR